ncbi:MAG: hypothetical protein M3R04_02895 [bacterium]|nr:hypothetical protein [bacterium]
MPLLLLKLLELYEDITPAVIGILSALVLLVGLFYFNVYILVRAGRVARRRRWSQLKWRDFESFRRSEATWRVFGMIGYVLGALGLITGIVEGIIEGLGST